MGIAMQRLEKMKKEIISEKRKRQTSAANKERLRIKEEVEKITTPPVYLVRYVNPIPHITSVSSNDSRKVVNLMLNGFRQRLKETAVGVISHLDIGENAIEFVMMASIPNDKITILPATEWIGKVVDAAKDRYGSGENVVSKVGGTESTAIGYGHINCSIEAFMNVAHEIATDLLGGSQKRRSSRGNVKRSGKK
ncbi:hypothetical protein ACOME3_010029 [Neoechinorhynchus agilis]